MATDNPHDPWYYAEQSKLPYITPEDISEAINAGATKVFLQQVVLSALACGACEDSGCCAFVASKMP